MKNRARLSGKLGYYRVVSRRSTTAKLQVHLAEYEALTMRCTYWLAFLVPIWAAMIGFLTLVAIAWKSIYPVVLLWGTPLGAQGIVLMWFQTIEEQYRAIAYIQEDLKPKVAYLLGSSDFWRYEATSAGRSDPLTWWGEWLCPAITYLVLILLLLVSILLPVLAPRAQVFDVKPSFLTTSGSRLMSQCGLSRCSRPRRGSSSAYE